MSRTIMITLRVDPDEGSSMKRLAQILRRSRSDAIRIAVLELLQQLERHPRLQDRPGNLDSIKTLEASDPVERRFM